MLQTSVYLPALLEYHYLGTEGGELVQMLSTLMLTDVEYADAHRSSLHGAQGSDLYPSDPGRRLLRSHGGGEAGGLAALPSLQHEEGVIRAD